MREQCLNSADDLVIHTEDRVVTPTFHRLRARVQGQIVFIGDYWLTAAEAESLRDWLSNVLPAKS